MEHNKVLLMILDGWGIGNHSKGDVVWSAHPVYLNGLAEHYPHAQLRTDGENVGLPDGQMGNSEVGHLNIGAGRVVYQDLVKINRAIRDNSIMENPEIKAAFTYARRRGCGCTSWDWCRTAAYTARLTISSNCATSRRSTAFTMRSCTASWMAVIPTR